jgi:hypothetical protein
MESNVSKKVKIPNHRKKDLEGFEDLIEDFLEDKEKQVIKSKLNEDRDYDSHQAYNFLELERQRVQKLSSMLSKKIPNVIEHNISSDLIEKFTSYNFNLKEEIIAESINFDSIFNKNLRLLYNKAFKKN